MCKQVSQHLVICPECGSPMILKPSKFKRGYYYGCSRHPVCHGSHGAHPNGSPLGVPANAETKRWRIKAHEVFNRLYAFYPPGKMRRKARSQAYRFLQEIMDLSKDEAHIGRFNIEQCQRLIELLSNVDEAGQ